MAYYTCTCRGAHDSDDRVCHAYVRGGMQRHGQDHEGEAPHESETGLAQQQT